MQEQKLERITPAQAGLDPRCIINMMDPDGEGTYQHNQFYVAASWKSVV